MGKEGGNVTFPCSRFTLKLNALDFFFFKEKKSIYIYIYIFRFLGGKNFFSLWF